MARIGLSTKIQGFANAGIFLGKIKADASLFSAAGNISAFVTNEISPFPAAYTSPTPSIRFTRCCRVGVSFLAIADGARALVLPEGFNP